MGEKTEAEGGGNQRARSARLKKEREAAEAAEAAGKEADHGEVDAYGWTARQRIMLQDVSRREVERVAGSCLDNVVGASYQVSWE